MALSRDSIRQAVVSLVATQFAALFPTVPLVWDNQPYDWDLPPELFIQEGIDITSSKRTSLGPNSPVRDRGFIVFTADMQDGIGTKNAFNILDKIGDMLKMQVSGNLELFTPALTPGGSARGRTQWLLRTDFIFHSV